MHVEDLSLPHIACRTFLLTFSSMLLSTRAEQQQLSELVAEQIDALDDELALLSCNCLLRGSECTFTMRLMMSKAIICINVEYVVLTQ